MASRDERRSAEDYLTSHGYQTVTDWLAGIRYRRAAAPTKAEIQSAVTMALEAGMNLSDIARVTGIPRQQFYQGKYDLSANSRSRHPGRASGNAEAAQQPEQ